MTPLEQLIAFFEKFPGVGARQAKRFAYHILNLRREEADELARLITSASSNITQCPTCYRYHTSSDAQCSICTSTGRDGSKLLIVSHDSDLDAIERSRSYDGRYFVLGGTVPLLHHSDNVKSVRAAALRAHVGSGLKQGLREVILAFAVNPDGDNTGRFVRTIVSEVDTTNSLSVFELGRGLSTGSELEYADPETIKAALGSRRQA